MAIVSVKEVWEDRDGEIADGFERRYTRQFRVRTDDESMGPIQVAFAAGLPKPYDAYTSADGAESDDMALCVAIKPKQQPDDPYHWLVTCEYRVVNGQPGAAGGAPLIGGEGGEGTKSKPGTGGPADKPEDRPWEISWGEGTMTRPLVKAYDFPDDPVSGSLIIPVTNSAGQQFSPLPEYELGYLTLTVARTVISFDPVMAREYRFALNSEDNWLFVGRGQAQLTSWTGKLVFYGRDPRWDETISIRFCPPELETWDVQVLDAGLMQLDGGTPPQLESIRDKMQQIVTEPWPLNGAGRALTRQQIEDGEVEYRTFYAYRKRPFQALGLT